MRRLSMCVPMIILLLTAACGGGEGGAKGSPEEELALIIRREYLEMAACSAVMEVTADYGERVYDYTIGVSWVKDGETVLTVTAPEEISGITARLREGSAVLEYAGVRWETGALDAAGMSPIDAVPALLAYAREGFMAECGVESIDGVQRLRILYRDPDTAAGVGQECSLWFDPQTHALLRGELSQDGFTVIQCTFTQFSPQQQSAPTPGLS